MQLNTDYDQSEMGYIPREWRIKTLDSVCDVRDGTHESPKFMENGVPFVTSKNIVNGQIDLSDIKYISLSDAESFDKRSKVCCGDILMSMIGTIGNATLIRAEPNFCIKNVALIKPNQISATYLIQLINSPLFQNSLSDSLNGGIQKFISLSALRNLKILVPSPLEQTAIANALSDADALIGSLQKLIAKKRQIKQGAMQTLLNPYENGVLKAGWMVQKLGGMCEKITTGKLDANAMVAHGVYPFFTCAKEHYWIDKYAFDSEALLVSGNGANVGYIHYYNGKFNAYQRTYVLSGFSNHIHFLKLYMERNLQERIRIEVNAGNTPYIVMSTLTEMDVFLPIDIAEQIHIAKILSDMDSEVAALESKLAKYQKIKQGMMQNLLTGRIRLV